MSITTPPDKFILFYWRKAKYILYIYMHKRALRVLLYIYLENQRMNLPNNNRYN